MPLVLGRGAAGFLKQEDAATTAAGALDSDSSGSEATAE